MRKESVFCNVCGAEIKKNQFGHIEEHLSVVKKWCYGSKHDGEIHSFELCCACYDKFTGGFKIPVSVE